MFAHPERDRIVRWAALAAATFLLAALLVVIAGASPALAGPNDGQAGDRQPDPPYLILQVNYGQDWVEGNYPVGYTLWLTVTDGVGTVKSVAELQTQQIPWWSPGQTGFSTNLGNPWSPSPPDILPGDWVYGRLDNGRTAEVQLGEITGTLDLAADTVTGNVHAGWLPAPLHLWCNVWEPGAPGLDLWIDPDGGSYTCNLGAAGWDLKIGDDVAVSYQEPNGNTVLNVFSEPAADLRLEKWAEGSGQAYPGGPSVFGLRVRNQGAAASAQVIVTDTLPFNATYGGDSSGVSPTFVGNLVVWDLGSLDPDGQIQFYVYLDNTASNGDTVHNVADAWTLYDENTGDNHAEADVQVVDDMPDLYVNKNPEPGNPAAGETMLWRLDYGNQRSVASGPVVLTDTLPAGTTVVEWWSQNGLGWTEVASNGQLVLETPGVPGFWGDQLYVRLALDPSLALGTQLTNTVQIATTPDADANNNWHQRDDVWVSAPYWNASVYKNLGWGTLVPGGLVEYNINVRNSGNAAATLTLTDVLPAGTSFVMAQQQGPTNEPFPPDFVDSTRAVWDLGVMQPGDGLDLQVRLAIAAIPAGTLLENCARVAMDHGDASLLDNESCHVAQVNAPGPNLMVEKTYRWNGEGQLEYDIQVRNVGTTELSNGVVTDLLPAGTTFNGNWWHWFQEPVTLTHQSAGQLAWTFQRLDPGRSASLRFQVDLDGSVLGVRGLAFTNTVEAPIPGDVAPADNTDTVTAYTGPDLYVEKQHTGGQAAPGEYITFTVEFGNANPWPWSTSAGTHLTDTLPAGMTFVTATVPGDPGQPWRPETVDGNTVVWGWGGMGGNNTWFFDLVVQIDPAADSGDVLVNTIVLGSDNPAQDLEYDDANNTASATIVVESLYRIYLPMLFKND